MGPVGCPRDWSYINVRGLGFIPRIHCPHYNGRTRGVPRRHDFRAMIQKIGGTGIAIENNCAIAFQDGRFKVICSKDYAQAYRIFRSGGGVLAERIPKTKAWTPIESLYRR